MSAQLENGHTRIANEIIEALCKLKISNYESRFLWALFRKTYGFQKKEDNISLSQFSELTEIESQHIGRTKTKLISKKIIYQNGKKIGFNKTIPEWVVPKQVVPEWVSGSTQTGSKTVPKQVHTKERKKLIQKKEKDLVSADSFFSSFKDESDKRVISKAKKYDLREKDVVYFAEQAEQWCMGSELENNTWIWWESFFNRWILRGIKQHKERLPKSERDEKQNKKTRLTRAERETLEILETATIRG